MSGAEKSLRKNYSDADSTRLAGRGLNNADIIAYSRLKGISATEAAKKLSQLAYPVTQKSPDGHRIAEIHSSTGKMISRRSAAKRYFNENNF